MLQLFMHMSILLDSDLAEAEDCLIHFCGPQFPVWHLAHGNIC